jgi:predicted DCC family thiol-disulfide oxidoreductase YuxK
MAGADPADPAVPAGPTGPADPAVPGGRPAQRSLPERALVLYDADCGVCVWLLSVLLRLDRARRLRSLALQRPEADDLLADLTPAERIASWHVISPAGTRQSGGAALAPLLELLPGGHAPAAALSRVPGLTDCGYRWTAEHRAQLAKLVPARVKRRARERVLERELAGEPLLVRAGDS